MKPQELKTEFIRLRAENRSYNFISEQLGIARGTCENWERELKEQITSLKAEQLGELYDSYYMTREARIRRLGDTLGRIDSALDDVDLSEVPPEKLLDHKLKYIEALKEEYIDLTPPLQRLEPGFGVRDIVDSIGDLLNRIRSGEVTTEQAGRECLVINSLLKAYETTELKTKVDALEAVLEGRQI